MSGRPVPTGDRRQRGARGRWSEWLAVASLVSQGYRILDRQWLSSAGEIDIVAVRGKRLVFVEVKARRTDAFGGAIHAVHQRKQEKLIRLAAQYLARHHIKDRLCRFDVVLLQGTDAAGSQIEHIQNAFEVSGDDLRW